MDYVIKQGLLDTRQGPPVIDAKDIKLLDHQLEMNKFIKTDVIPAQKKKLKKNNTVDMSYTEVSERIDAVVKYFEI